MRFEAGVELGMLRKQYNGLFLKFNLVLGDLHMSIHLNVAIPVSFVI